MICRLSSVSLVCKDWLEAEQQQVPQWAQYSIGPCEWKGRAREVYFLKRLIAGGHLKSLHLILGMPYASPHQPEGDWETSNSFVFGMLIHSGIKVNMVLLSDLKPRAWPQRRQHTGTTFCLKPVPDSWHLTK